MKVLFFGYQVWGLTTLRALHTAGHEIVGVLTHPESRHVYETIWSDSVEDFAREHSIPVMVCRQANGQAARQFVRDAAPEIMVASNWRTWLSPELVELAKLGALNIHDALLPRYCGFAPVTWAIIGGETETGVTVHQVTPDFDLGPILLQHRVPIHFNDTTIAVIDRTMPLFASLPVESLDLIASGKAVFREQDPSQATFFHKRSERDSLIDWKQPSLDIYNLVRAQADPFPNAFTYYQGTRVQIKRASLPPSPYRGTPGRIFRHLDDSVVVLCGSRIKGAEHGQALVVHEAALDGEDPRPAAEILSKVGRYLGERHNPTLTQPEPGS